MKYAMIDKLRTQHPVANLCALLDVAKSGYQAWNSGKVVPPRKLKEMRLLVAIKVAHQKGRGTYGPKKIKDELADQGMVAGLNRIKRLRTLYGIRCTHKKKSKSRPTPSINCPSLITYSIGSLFALHPIRFGSLTSPTSRPMKVGCFWQRSKIYTPVKSWAGLWTAE